MQTLEIKSTERPLSDGRPYEVRLLISQMASGVPAPFRRQMTWRARKGQIATFFIAGIIYAVLIAPFHHNEGCLLNTDCPLCKFALDFSACDRTDTETLAAPGATFTSFIPESEVCIFGICPAILTPRAPPA